MSDAAISLTNVSKCFKRYARSVDRLKDLILPGKNRSDDFWAVQPLNLEVPKGETFGIVGQNGSGKSTLLQLIVGTLQPTTGSVAVNGRISALLELGSGFNPEFTGRQNIYFNGRILGLSQSEITERIGDIEAFADIGDFMDQPVKSYSSGMFVRLAFSVAIHVKPDILVVDEALAVGDGIFVHRCMAKIKAFQDQGGTILFVSHDVESVTRLCSKMIWMNQGKMMAIGEPAEVSRQYQAWMYEQIHATALRSPTPEARSLEASAVETSAVETPTVESISTQSDARPLEAAQVAAMTEVPIDALPNPKNPFTQSPYQQFGSLARFGNGRAEVIAFDVLDADLKPIGVVYPGDELRIRIQLRAMDTLQKLIVGVSIYDRLRTAIAAFNTTLLKIDLPTLEKGQTLAVEFRFRWMELCSGSYGFEPAIADGTHESHEMLDWVQCVLSLQSSVRHPTVGLIRIPNVQTQTEILQTAPC